MGYAEAWERREEETEPAWEAFHAYRDQGPPRSLARLAGELGKSRQHMEQLSATHGWVRRVAAYDRYLDAQRRAERERAILEMERRQATQLAAAAAALSQPIQAFLERIHRVREEGGDPFASMSIGELGRMAASSIRHLSSVVEAQRLVAGLSTENVQPDAPATVQEARRRAEAMSRGELEDYLLGVDDGRREFLRELGLDDPA